MFPFGFHPTEFCGKTENLIISEKWLGEKRGKPALAVRIIGKA
jgi:hypothetical protein